MYEKAGAGAEVTPVQTGGRIGTGRWIIQEAQDVSSATLDVVRPFRERVADYRDNPWHAVQWTAAAPKGGLRCELVVVDDEETLDRMGPDGLEGRAVLTRLDIRSRMERFAQKGAAAVIMEKEVANNPGAVAWIKFGWGAVPMNHATAKLVGLVVSRRQGDRLRGQLRQHGRLVVQVRVDARRYVGTPRRRLRGGPRRRRPPGRGLGHRPLRRAGGRGQRLGLRRHRRDRPRPGRAHRLRGAAAAEADDPPDQRLRVLRVLRLPGEGEAAAAAPGRGLHRHPRLAAGDLRRPPRVAVDGAGLGRLRRLDRGEDPALHPAPVPGRRVPPRPRSLHGHQRHPHRRSPVRLPLSVDHQPPQARRQLLGRLPHLGGPARAAEPGGAQDLRRRHGRLPLLPGRRRHAGSRGDRPLRDRPPHRGSARPPPPPRRRRRRVPAPRPRDQPDAAAALALGRRPPRGDGRAGRDEPRDGAGRRQRQAAGAGGEVHGVPAPYPAAQGPAHADHREPAGAGGPRDLRRPPEPLGAVLG